MKPQIYKGSFFEVETSAGTEIVPADLLSPRAAQIGFVWAGSLQDFCEGEVLVKVQRLEMQSAWLGRLHLPGFTDSTPWSAGGTEKHINEILEQLYGDQE